MKFTDVAGIMNIPYVAEKVKLSHVAEIVKLSHVAGILEAGSMYDRILHWKLLKISVQIPYPKNFEQLPVQYAGTKHEICRLFTIDYQYSHKNTYGNSW